MDSLYQIIRKRSRMLSDMVYKYLLETGKIKNQLSPDRQKNLALSVELFVMDSLCAHATHPFAPVRISKRSGTYSSTHPEFRGVGYRMHIDTVYPALIELGYLKKLQAGYYDRRQKKGQRETYTLTQRLLADLQLDNVDQQFGKQATWLDQLIVSEEVIPQPASIRVTIRESRSKEKKSAVPRWDVRTWAIDDKLQKINASLRRHWIDLDISEPVWEGVKQGWIDKKGRFHTLQLNKRRLHRIYHDDDLQTGGRFYGGWWQEIPSELRKHIVIDGKQTVECDFSTMNPSILYAKAGLPCPDDSYIPIAGEEHRETIKDAFNAMLNAHPGMKSKPEKLDLSTIDLGWPEIVTRIQKFHAPIEKSFFSNAGMRLMYEDSQLAEEVMLRFADMGYPCLPVHDSFIVHHGLETELLDIMKDAFKARFGRDAGIKTTKVVRQPNSDDESSLSLEVKGILNALDTPQDHRLEAFRQSRQDSGIQ